jgi:hypothetical protein
MESLKTQRDTAVSLVEWVESAKITATDDLIISILECVTKMCIISGVDIDRMKKALAITEEELGMAPKGGVQ